MPAPSPPQCPPRMGVTLCAQLGTPLPCAHRGGRSGEHERGCQSMSHLGWTSSLSSTGQLTLVAAEALTSVPSSVTERSGTCFVGAQHLVPLLMLVPHLLNAPCSLTAPALGPLRDPPLLRALHATHPMPPVTWDRVQKWGPEAHEQCGLMGLCVQTRDLCQVPPRDRGMEGDALLSASPSSLPTPRAFFPRVCASSMSLVLG